MKKLLITLIICIMCFCDAVPVMATGAAVYNNAGTENLREDVDRDSDSTPENTHEYNAQDDSSGSAPDNTINDNSEGAQKESCDKSSEQLADKQGESKDAKNVQASKSDNAAAKSSSELAQTNLPEGELLFITLAEDHTYRWNVNGNANKNNVVHLDDSSGNNCNFRLKHVGDEWYGIKHIKNNGVDMYADIEDKSTSPGKKLHLWEDSDDKVSGNNHRQFAFYFAGTDSNNNEQFYIKNKNSGLWMGYEDTDKNGKPSYGDKIIQTDESNRKLWIITPETVPMVGGEMKNPATGSDAHIYCEMFKKGTIDAINRNNDAALDRTELHFYEMGTSSKWKLEYINKYAAYEIHAITDGEAERHNKVWDVDGESGSDGKHIWLWSDQSKDKNENTSQLWRFIKQNDGSYKIMNVRSGKYVNCTDSGVLLQKSSGTDIELDIISGSTPDINFDYSQDWMSVVPDGALLSSVNIPGSHDTGTAAIIEDAIPTISLTSCQKYYYGEQLNVGVRSFDVRCNATKNDAKPKDVNIIHGSELWQCYNRDGNKLTLDDILSDSVRFLKDDKHKTEALIIMLKPDAGSTEGLARAVGDFIKNNGDYVYKGNGIPSMGEARGKIVFIRRYDIDTNKYNPTDDGLKEEWFGINLSDWDTHSYGEHKYAINIYDKNDMSVYAQDAYNEYSYGKWDYIEGTMRQTTGADTSHAVPADAWIYNYTSCAVGFPLGLTRDINPKLFYDKANCIDDRRLGMVMMNFVDRPMSRLIYETNKSDSKFYATKATFPSSISVIYGQKLSEAEMTWPEDADGNLQNGDGTWKFEEENYIPTEEDIRKHKTFKLTYTPKDTRLAPVTKEVLITTFIPKEINVKIDNKDMTYGDSIPELTYSVIDKSQLVNGDTSEDLDIDLMLDPYPWDLSAGMTYTIKGIPCNKNYSVKLDNGTLKINKKTVGIRWSDTKNLVYTGEPVNVSAELTGILDGDACTAVVTTDGNTVGPIGPSWNGSEEPPTKYTATADLTGADSGNYRLPDDHSIDYYIRRNTPDADDYAFPQKAVMTYGQQLSEADLIGASGSGEFIFIDKAAGKPIGDTIPAKTGEYTYTIAYVPENTALEHAVTSEINVTVNKKPLTAVAENKSKTYGNQTPELTYDINPSQLVGDDTKEDLKLTLTAGAGDDQYCNAGKYKIKKAECKSDNYYVTVDPGELTVSKLTAEIKWPSKSEYVYDGNAVKIIATVDNCAREGDCTVGVFGGVAVTAGSYKATAVVLSNRNYNLPEDKTKLVFDYKIVKANPTVTFPTAAVLTYGETLNQAVLTGQSGDGTFEFENSSEMLKVSNSGQQRTMIFTPKDSKNYNSAKQNVPVTVKQKPLAIKADNKQKTYGQETPELTWHMDESQLVAGDSADEFQFRLTAGEGNSQFCNVGGYAIKPAGTVSKNENYTIEFDNGTLKVDPLMVSFGWSIPHNLKVGDPEPTAQILNLVQPTDDCSLVVKSDGTENASWTEDSDELKIYNAEITGLAGDDKFNYTLPDEELTRQYLVRRNDPSDYNMPKMAVMTYGQTLNDAELMLASGDGTFSFVREENPDENIGSEMPQSAGIFKYTVKFKPADPNQKSVHSEVSVLVKPKKITVYAENSEKTYGDRTKLSFTLDASQLVGDDTKEALKLKLTAISTEGEDKPDGNHIHSPAGAYDIVKGSCDNISYDVTVVPAALWIHQKEISLVWSDVSRLYYTGNPVSVTAKATGLLKGDICDVKVVNGNRTELGTYTALAVSLSNGNYILPRDAEQLMKQYTIRKAADPAPNKPEGNENGGGDGKINNSDGNGHNDAADKHGSVNSTRTSDPMSPILMLTLCILAISSGTVIAALLRKSKGK